MGNCDSKSPPKATLPKERKLLTFGKDPNLKMSDYMCSKKKGEVVVKEDMKGQQFVMEESESCSVYLLDTVASLTVDYCTSCVLVTGPVESSTFIRNCKDCTFVVATAQFRTRDCEGCRFFLHSNTEPIIESSKNLEIGCYDYHYFNMERHFEKSKFSVWNNKWSEVYDFTPSPGTTNKNSRNWKPMDMKESSHKSHVLPIPSQSPPIPSPSAVPLTHGKHSNTPGRHPVVAIMSSKVNFDAVLSAVLEWQNKHQGGKDPSALLVRSRKFRLTREQSNSLFNGIGDKKKGKALMKQCNGGEMAEDTLAVEFSTEGEEGGREIQELFREVSKEQPESCVVVEGVDAEQPAKNFFSFFKEEQ